METTGEFLRRIYSVRNSLHDLLNESLFAEAEFFGNDDDSCDDWEQVVPPKKNVSYIYIRGRGGRLRVFRVLPKKQELFEDMERAARAADLAAKTLISSVVSGSELHPTCQIGLSSDLLELGVCVSRINDQLERMEHSAIGAAITNAGTAEVYAELHPKIKLRVDELMSGGMAYTPATEAVAKECNVSGKYVREVYGQNPAPRNKGRKR